MVHEGRLSGAMGISILLPYLYLYDHAFGSSTPIDLSISNNPFQVALITIGYFSSICTPFEFPFMINPDPLRSTDITLVFNIKLIEGFA